MSATYDTKDPACLAAHNAGEATALYLAKSGDFSPRYVAMAVVQDALIAFFKARAEQPSAGGEK